jgi:hypothetical protein
MVEQLADRHLLARAIHLPAHTNLATLAPTDRLVPAVHPVLAQHLVRKNGFPSKLVYPAPVPELEQLRLAVPARVLRRLVRHLQNHHLLEPRHLLYQVPPKLA